MNEFGGKVWVMIAFCAANAAGTSSMAKRILFIHIGFSNLINDTFRGKFHKNDSKTGF